MKNKIDMTFFSKVGIYTLLFMGLLTLPGCFSTSMMSTAKTLDKGEQEFVLGASGYFYGGEPVGAAPDISYRRGISDKMDFGASYSLGLMGHARTDLKYELCSWNNHNNFLSTGFGMDFYIPTEFADNPFVGSTIPLYLSINHDHNVTPYFGQRFTFSWQGLNAYKFYNSQETITTFQSLEHSVFYSGAMGLRIGEGRKKYFFEASYAYRGDNSFGAWENYNTPGEYINISDFHRSWTFQLTFGFILGNK